MDDYVHTSQFHSVHLHKDMCKGCTICVTGCPVEAIRVRDGKAYIIEEQCIDCGECIRTCPSKAKYALSASIEILENYNKTVAIVTPSFYSQFNVHYSISQIHQALHNIGFTDVYDVSEDAVAVSQATGFYLDGHELYHQSHEKPVISSSCPVIVKLIQVRFPSLIDNLLPVLPPVELTARRARLDLGNECGIFLISPCSAKITVVRSPLGYETSAITDAFSFSALYLPVLTELRAMHAEEKKQTEHRHGDSQIVKMIAHTRFFDGLVWSRESGESECISHFLSCPEKFSWITSCGLRQVIQTLEAIEDGQLSQYEFAEMEACEGGCIGGPLMVKEICEASAILRNRIKTVATNYLDLKMPHIQNIFFSSTIVPRPARRLSSDFCKAKNMMEQIELITAELPGLDCGSCGAPNCRALAEDIVKKKAHFEDCVIILKDKYEKLLFGDIESK